MDPYGPIWTNMVSYGPIWTQMVSCGLIWTLMVSYGPIWTLMVSYGLIWTHMVSYGPIWTHMVSYGPLWSHMDPYGSIWTNMVSYGPLWTHMVSYGVLNMAEPCCFVLTGSNTSLPFTTLPLGLTGPVDKEMVNKAEIDGFHEAYVVELDVMREQNHLANSLLLHQQPTMQLLMRGLDRLLSQISCREVNVAASLVRGRCLLHLFP